VDRAAQSFQPAAIRRIAARVAWQAYFRTHDVFLLPTAFVPAFPHDHSEAPPGPLVSRLDERVITAAKGPHAYTDMFFWISFATLSGLPATTAPAGLTRDGLPVGIQIIGPYLEDATPIDLAGRLADMVGGGRTAGRILRADPAPAQDSLRTAADREAAARRGPTGRGRRQGSPDVAGRSDGVGVNRSFSAPG
jgi:Asp-tRNA(Asn)/Glu-tRNA(Gln) amidotransferase A subunit family amidase